MDKIETSIFEMFKVGFGPSSSHTMGPMRAGQDFRSHLLARAGLPIDHIKVTFHGSIGATGKGHGSDRAVVAGLAGFDPDRGSSTRFAAMVDDTRASGVIPFGEDALRWDFAEHISWCPLTPHLPHANTLDFEAVNSDGTIALFHRYLSVGGGFVERVLEDGACAAVAVSAPKKGGAKFVFTNFADVMSLLKRRKYSWWQFSLENEKSYGVCDEDEVYRRIAALWACMRKSVHRGLRAKGHLPGGLNLPRRASRLYRAAQHPVGVQVIQDPLSLHVQAYALAVSEENAAGQRVVTAPTNGAAGVIPAVFGAVQDLRALPEQTIFRGLLTAGLMGSIIKANASISGADIGCQGEIGSASAMAAGGLVEMFGGSARQVEMASEICIEHHLGMTCDPVDGLVQIPCIERNVMGAVKALNAATLALNSDGRHRISMDQAVEAMLQIGHDMNAKYRETAQGGLALVATHLARVEC